MSDDYDFADLKHAISGILAGGCEVDGYQEDARGQEHYWHCEEPAVTEVDGYRMCAGHANTVREVTRTEDEPDDVACGHAGEDALDAQDADAAWAEPGEPIPLAELEDGLNRGQAGED